MYDRLRDDLMSRDLSNTENYDRAIFTVSTTFLGASIAFIKFIVPLEHASFIPLLIVSWALLFLALSSSIYAFRIGNKALALRREQAERYYIHEDLGAFNEDNASEIWNSYLNTIAGMALILAMLMLIIFVSINISSDKSNEESNMTIKKSPSTTIRVQKSANTPAMEKVPVLKPNVGGSANVPTLEQAPNSSKPSPGSSDK